MLLRFETPVALRDDLGDLLGRDRVEREPFEVVGPLHRRASLVVVRIDPGQVRIAPRGSRRLPSGRHLRGALRCA